MGSTVLCLSSVHVICNCMDGGFRHQERVQKLSQLFRDCGRTDMKTLSHSLVRRGIKKIQCFSQRGAVVSLRCFTLINPFRSQLGGYFLATKHIRDAPNSSTLLTAVIELVT